MKYIDAEKLKAEIEKRAKFHDDAMKACIGLNNIAITHSAGWKEDTELLTIIDSLQQEQTEGWNKADCVKEIPFSLIYEEFAEHWRLGKAVEPGDYYIPISRLRWGGNLEELSSNVDLEKLALEKYPVEMVFRDPFDERNCDDGEEDINEYKREAYLEGLKKGYELGRKGGKYE